MSAPGKYLNSPVAKNASPMTVMFYFPDQNTSASCEISGSVFDALKAGAAREGISLGEFLSQAVALKNQPPKVGKNFCAVNMSPDLQKEMRKLAKEVDWTWNSLLIWALADARSKLDAMVNCKRKTGLSANEMGLFVVGNRN